MLRVKDLVGIDKQLPISFDLLSRYGHWQFETRRSSETRVISRTTHAFPEHDFAGLSTQPR